MSDDLALLMEAALAAGKLGLDLRARGLEIRSKEGGSPVTNGDLASNELLRERLMGARPDYGWLSEEDPDTEERLTKRRLFIIDPIDGTSAYMKGREYWSVSVAVVEDGRPIAGVVYAPSLDEMYAAAAGGGATLNGAPIRASACSTEDGCAILGDPKMFAHPSWPTPWPDMRIESRNSVAYRMCLVASGAFDAVLAPSNKHDWDLAAGDLIVNEAGAHATDHVGGGFRYNHPVPRQPSLVCAGPALHPRLLARLSHIELKR